MKQHHTEMGRISKNNKDETKDGACGSDDDKKTKEEGKVVLDLTETEDHHPEGMYGLFVFEENDVTVCFASLIPRLSLTDHVVGILPTSIASVSLILLIRLCMPTHNDEQPYYIL